MDVMNSAADTYHGPVYDPITNRPYEEDDPYNPYGPSRQPEEGVNPIYDAGKKVTNTVGDWFKSLFNNAGNYVSPSFWSNQFRNFLGINDSNNSAASEGKIAYTSSGIPYDATNIDSQINALMQEYANKRDDESYDRLIAALKRNGINPAIALSGSASPMASDSGYRSNYSLTDKDQINSALKAGSILALLIGLLMKSK